MLTPLPCGSYYVSIELLRLIERSYLQRRSSLNERWRDISEGLRVPLECFHRRCVDPRIQRNCVQQPGQRPLTKQLSSRLPSLIKSSVSLLVLEMNGRIWGQWGCSNDINSDWVV